MLKAKDVQVGVTYKNSGAGRTQRKVLAIGPYHPADMPAMWHSMNPRPDKPVVKYADVGEDSLPVYMYVHTFAAWAAGPVSETPAPRMIQLAACVEQDPDNPESGAVGYMTFLPNGEMRVFDKFAEAQGVALDTCMSPVSTADHWVVYPLYAGAPITG